MTKNQILYQELQQTKYRDEQNIKLGFSSLEESKRHNTVVETETERHNRATEEQNLVHLGIEKYNAETNRLNYGVNAMNAETNRYNAETNRLNYQVNQYNAETNRLNYGVNLMNAQSNRMQAQAAGLQAQAALQNAATNQRSVALNYMLGVGNLAVSRERMQHDYELGLEQQKSNAMQAAAAQRNAETSYLRYQSEDALNKANIDYIDARAYGQFLLNQQGEIDLEYYYDMKDADLANRVMQAGVLASQMNLNDANYNLVVEKTGESQVHQVQGVLDIIKEGSGMIKNWIGNMGSSGLSDIAGLLTG